MTFGPMTFTEADIAQIGVLRQERKTWGEIAAVFSVSRHTVALIAKKHGLWTKTVSFAPETAPSGEPELPSDILDRSRQPLAPGHWITWSAITRGTLLDGVRYPYG